MTVKKSVSLTDESVGILNKRKTFQENNIAKLIYSTSINQIIENYEKIVRESTPRLSQKEWKILANVYKKTFTQKLSLPIHIANDMLTYKGQIDISIIASTDKTYAKLINKVNNLSQIEQMSILDRICCYFSKA
jgi:hypothetical protein